MDDIDDNITAVTEKNYAGRPWYRKHPFRWEVTVSYFAVGLGAAIGVGAVSMNSKNDTQRAEETIVQIVCGIRGFVDGLLDAGSEREVVLARFDESLPDVTCPTP